MFSTRQKLQPQPPPQGQRPLGPPPRGRGDQQLQLPESQPPQIASPPGRGGSNQPSQQLQVMSPVEIETKRKEFLEDRQREPVAAVGVTRSSGSSSQTRAQVPARMSQAKTKFNLQTGHGPEKNDDSDDTDNPDQYFTRGEINDIFTTLREDQVRAIEEAYAGRSPNLDSRDGVFHNVDAGDSNGDGDDNGSSLGQPLRPPESWMRGQREVIGDRSTEISHQHFKIENGTVTKSVCTMYRPERYRLAYIPWTFEGTPGKKIGGFLARVDSKLMLTKTTSDNQKMIFVGRIKIRNVSRHHYISFNVNDYKSNVFTVRTPVGYVAPGGVGEVVIKTTDAIPFRMVDLAKMDKPFSVYIAPCKVIDLYSKLEAQSQVSNNSALHDGRHGDQAQAGAFATEEKFFSTKITEQHFFDFWRSYKSDWFPKAQICTVKELCPREPRWMEEPSQLEPGSHDFSSGLGISTILPAFNRKSKVARTDSKTPDSVDERIKYSHVLFDQERQEINSFRKRGNPLWVELFCACFLFFCLFQFLYKLFPSLNNQFKTDKCGTEMTGSSSWW